MVGRHDGRHGRPRGRQRHTPFRRWHGATHPAQTPAGARGRLGRGSPTPPPAPSPVLAPLSRYHSGPNRFCPGRRPHGRATSPSRAVIGSVVPLPPPRPLKSTGPVSPVPLPPPLFRARAPLPSALFLPFPRPSDRLGVGEEEPLTVTGVSSSSSPLPPCSWSPH